MNFRTKALTCGNFIRSGLLYHLLFASLLTMMFSSCISLLPTIEQQKEVIPIPDPPKDELRGVWLSRFEYTKSSPSHNQDSIKLYIATTIRNAAKANFNVVFFQIRGNGDAYYTPGLEPWGELLTGIPGQDPGWDPLQFALDSAHYYGLELHAWVNTFPVWRGTEPPPDSITPTPPYLLHPEWLVADSAGTPMPLSDHYVSLSPGIPAVHDYLITLVSDIVSRYDIDGVHFDYIRYPEGSGDSQYSHDSISVSLFNSLAGNPLQLDWADWQRNQLTIFVSKMYNALTVMDPQLKVSAAVIGSYRRNGWNAYNAVYQDPRRWTELGKMDFILPMIYWPRSHETYGFMELSEEYRQVGTVDRYLIPGIGSYKYNGDETPYLWSEVEGQIDDLRRNKFPGMCFFGSKSLTDHWENLARTRFRYPANIPALVWKDNIQPDPPEIISLDRKENTIVLAWTSSSGTDVKRYNIYFSSTTPIDTTRAENLWYITPDNGSWWEIPFESNYTGYIAVSALDAAWNESALSTPVFVGKNKK